jgi:alkaline phosphatase D
MKFLLLCSSVVLFFCACKPVGSDYLKSFIPLSSDYDLTLAPFYHGVASGDPLEDGVIIWTKATPPYHQSVNVIWKVSDRADMSNTLFDGQQFTDSLTNYTTKIDVRGLNAGTTYYYQFEALGKKSMIGRTKTLPKNDANSVVLAVASCSNVEWGYFSAYKNLAEKNVDAVIHLGDYIYEYGTSTYGDTTIGRINDPLHEIISLEDYRTRYSQYRLDKDLQAVHQAHPFICIWDDHEVSNNSYTLGAENHQENEGDYQLRKEIAKKVYYEWIPIRDNESKKHYRSFEFGNLARLIMLDERLEGRTAPPETYEAINNDSKMLGQEQFAWLAKELDTNQQLWKIIGNQVVFSDLDVSAVYPESKVNLDAWDGFPSEKKEIIAHLSESNFKNVVLITGDTHCSWAFEVEDENKKSVAVEIGTPSITSANYDEYTGKDTVLMTEQLFLKANPHLKYVDLRNHGYVIISLTKEKGIAEWYYEDNIRTPNSKEYKAKVIEFKNNQLLKL